MSIEWEKLPIFWQLTFLVLIFIFSTILLVYQVIIPSVSIKSSSRTDQSAQFYIIIKVQYLLFYPYPLNISLPLPTTYFGILQIHKGINSNILLTQKWSFHILILGLYENLLEGGFAFVLSTTTYKSEEVLDLLKENRVDDYPSWWNLYLPEITNIASPGSGKNMTIGIIGGEWPSGSLELRNWDFISPFLMRKNIELGGESIPITLMPMGSIMGNWEQWEFLYPMRVYGIISISLD